MGQEQTKGIDLVELSTTDFIFESAKLIGFGFVGTIMFGGIAKGILESLGGWEDYWPLLVLFGVIAHIPQYAMCSIVVSAMNSRAEKKRNDPRKSEDK